MNGLHHDSHLPNVRAYVASETAPRRSLSLVGGGGTRPPVDGERKRFVAKGHDAQLQDAQNTHREIRIVTTGGETVYGKIIRRDKFTITLEITQGSEAGANEIFYKHAIESVRIKAPAAAQGQD